MRLRTAGLGINSRSESRCLRSRRLSRLFLSLEYLLLVVPSSLAALTTE